MHETAELTIELLNDGLQQLHEGDCRSWLPFDVRARTVPGSPLSTEKSRFWHARMLGG